MLVLLLCQLFVFGLSYKPVLFLHGIDDDAKAGNSMKGWLDELHPGTSFLGLPLYEGPDVLFVSKCFSCENFCWQQPRNSPKHKLLRQIIKNKVLLEFSCSRKNTWWSKIQWQKQICCFFLSHFFWNFYLRHPIFLDKFTNTNWKDWELY